MHCVNWTILRNAVRVIGEHVQSRPAAAWMSNFSQKSWTILNVLKQWVEKGWKTLKDQCVQIKAPSAQSKHTTTIRNLAQNSGQSQTKRNQTPCKCTESVWCIVDICWNKHICRQVKKWSKIQDLLVDFSQDKHTKPWSNMKGRDLAPFHAIQSLASLAYI